jgi:hypothetical protein
VILRLHPTHVCFDPGGVLNRVGGSWAESCPATGVELREAEHFAVDDLADNVAAAERAGLRAVLIDPHGDTAVQRRPATASAGLQLT